MSEDPNLFMRSKIEGRIVGKKIEAVIVEGRTMTIRVEGPSEIILEFAEVREFYLKLPGEWRFEPTGKVGRPKRKVALPPKADKQTKRKLKVNPNVIAASDLYEAGKKILEERKK